ncbi:hypothetical protein YTPLAS73_03590 [Nitrosarchaeum sp.]|nr:hypothetical protein YTPLAS73_03590 [Nitrosarchaeum sp.]
MKTTFVDINKQVVKVNTIQNQIVKTTIDATIQNIKTFNDNVSAFADLNRDIYNHEYLHSYNQKTSVNAF